MSEGVLENDFLYGFATAAYQIEGGWDQGGKGLSVWDIALKNQDNGEVGCDSFNRWREDVELVKSYGAKVYRFSISWPRVIPLGGRNDPVNREGIEYYSKLIDGLLEAGITPMVTLFHWDVPEAIQTRYGGFLPGDREEELYLDYARYARVCFEAFGDRVKHWITHNEPHSFTVLTAMLLEKDTFDVDTDRWTMARTLLLTHAHAVKVYRDEFQEKQQGQIGITLNIEWVEPFDQSPAAIDAAQRSLDVMAGLYADPIYHGRWNPRTVELANGNLRPWSEDEIKLVAGSSDFFGLNHYSTRWATGKVLEGPKEPFEVLSGGVEHTTERDGKPIGRRGHNGHPYTVPWGFHSILKYVEKTWSRNNVTDKVIPIIVTENGYAGQDEGDRSMDEIIEDEERIEYFTGYVDSLVKAKQEGVPIVGYMAWSLMDNLEWSMGYAPRFGVTHVDRENGLKRTPKGSALYLRDRMAKLIKSE